MSAICAHTDSITITELHDEIAGCTDCLAIGGKWLHLRMCQSCGHIALVTAGSSRWELSVWTPSQWAGYGRATQGVS